MTILFEQIFAAPMYEFLDTFVATKVAPNVQAHSSDFTAPKIFLRFVFRGILVAISTFLACLLPFFGDFIALTGSLAAFTLQGGFIHHMIIKVWLACNIDIDFTRQFTPISSTAL